MSSTTEKKYSTNSQFTENNDDSFDAEFDLLESTLSELKEIEPENKDSKEHFNSIQEITTISADIKNHDSLDCLELYKSQTFNSQPLDSSSSQELGTIPDEPSNFVVSSSIQHFKSADISNSNVLNDHFACRVEHDFISNSNGSCPGSNSTIVHFMNCNETEILKYNLKGYKNNNVVVSNCDSSMEGKKDLEQENMCEVDTVSRSRNRDINLDESEVFNLESSLLSPGSPTILNTVESKTKKLQEGPEENVVQITMVNSCLINKDNSNAENVCDKKCDVLSQCSFNKSSEIDASSHQFEGNSKFELDNCSMNSVGHETIGGGLKEGSTIYCSTPDVSKEKLTNRPTKNEETPLKDNTDFGKISPLNKTSMKKILDLKRKNLGLECIEEVDENLSDIPVEKKLKIDNVLNKNEDSNVTFDNDKSLAKPCYETPAKSILKKWGSSGGSFLIIDECGESDDETHVKSDDDNPGPVMTDDFEVEYKSLTEELMKSSSNNIETLEKYHSQVQHESQMDDEKFDELIQELTLYYALDEKTPSTLHKNELVENNSMIEGKTTEHVSDLNKTVDGYNEESQSKCTKTIHSCEEGEGGVKLVLKEETPAESSTSNEEVPSSSKDNLGTPDTENLGINNADEKAMTIDEEDILLEENTDSKKKPYEFFEFVSTDPQENEDNYNPEWQKLGRLTSDEERYKAVRDRWRSLVPPDPNRDLTCRQWRKKNNKPPLNLQSLNNNHQMFIDDKKTKRCTAVFEMKIKKMVQDLKTRRDTIYDRRIKDFQDLAKMQDDEQILLLNRGGNHMEYSMMHKQHIEECRELKYRYDQELKEITAVTEENIRTLKKASDEVLLFQKFYRGVGAGDDEVCMLMTDIQVQELMETEQMLEQYSKFYC